MSMSVGDKVFAGSIPENYDQYLVPLIFQSYAEDMARRVGAQSPKMVLETACGSGVVTRAMAAVLAPDAQYVATDLNQPMLDYAKSRQAGDTRVSWRQAVALELPLDDASRSDLLPVRRNVLPGSHKGVSRGQAGAQARWAFRVQRVGPNRGVRVCRQRDEGAGSVVPQRPSALPRTNPAWLLRCGADPKRATGGGLQKAG